MMNFFFGILCFIFGNIISFLDKRKKNTIDFILKPNRKNILKGNPKLIFSLSRILEMFPNRIPLAFNCYQKALTGRYILNLFRIKNSLTIGFNPIAVSEEDKLHSWLETDISDVCGFASKEKYLTIKVYE
jgi:hypothetical protein